MNLLPFLSAQRPAAPQTILAKPSGLTHSWHSIYMWGSGKPFNRFVQLKAGKGSAPSPSAWTMDLGPRVCTCCGSTCLNVCTHDHTYLLPKPLTCTRVLQAHINTADGQAAAPSLGQSPLSFGLNPPSSQA